MGERGLSLTLRRRTTSKGVQVEEELVGDIMALCIMSKCGGNVVVSERKGRGCGEGIMALCIMSKCGGNVCVGERVFGGRK